MRRRRPSNAQSGTLHSVGKPPVAAGDATPLVTILAAQIAWQAGPARAATSDGAGYLCCDTVGLAHRADQVQHRD
jgi:hypothetical protein